MIMRWRDADDAPAPDAAPRDAAAAAARRAGRARALGRPRLAVAAAAVPARRLAAAASGGSGGDEGDGRSRMGASKETGKRHDIGAWSEANSGDDSPTFRGGRARRYSVAAQVGGGARVPPGDGGDGRSRGRC